MATQAYGTFKGLYSLHKMETEAHPHVLCVCRSLKPAWNKLGDEDLRGALWQTPAPFGQM